MTKKSPLYVLVIFLIIVNAFFLYNYLGSGEKEDSKAPKRPGMFLVKELGFDDSQKAQFRLLGKGHHQRMRGLSDDIKMLKDELFNGLSDNSLKNINIDSIANLIGKNEAAKDLEVFRHFKEVQQLCTDAQKEKFSDIVEKALRRGAREQGPPHGGRPDGNRPRPNGPDGNKPPPRDH